MVLSCGLEDTYGQVGEMRNRERSVRARGSSPDAKSLYTFLVYMYLVISFQAFGGFARLDIGCPGGW